MKSVYIFPDDSLLAEREHVTRVMGQPCRLPDPVLRPDRPTDRFGVTFATVLYNETKRVFQAWYTAHTRDSSRCVGDPLEARLAPQMTAYAESIDGVVWEKPNLGLIEFEGSRDNNLCDVVHTDGVILDHHDADESRRYKRFMYDSSKRALHLLCSPDGLRWAWPTEERPLFEGWETVHDTHTFMGWDEGLGKYVAFLRPPVSLNPHRRRLIGVSMTEDVLDWPAPAVVLQADEFDPSSTDNRGRFVGMDLYCMQAFRYGPGFLGLLNNFDQNLAAEFNDPIYVTLACSPDCVHWHRTLRSRFLNVGAPGTFDGGMTYTVTKPVIHNDEIYIYYGGYPHVHQGWCPAHELVSHDARPAVGLARLRLDGFFGLYTNPYPGRIVTKPIPVSGSRLLVNTLPDTTQGGWLRVEVQDESGRPFEGLSKDDCTPITEDGLYHEVRWESRRTLAELVGRQARIALYQRENVFYAFRFAD